MRRWLPGIIPVRRAASIAAGVALAAFHADLLARRAADGSLFQPSVAARWIGALLLVALAVRFVRKRVSLRTGRKALSFWLLVLVLHALSGVPVPVEATLLPQSPVPAELTLLLPTALAFLLISRSLRTRQTASARLILAVSRRGRSETRWLTHRGHVRRRSGRGPPA